MNLFQYEQTKVFKGKAYGVRLGCGSLAWGIRYECAASKEFNKGKLSRTFGRITTASCRTPWANTYGIRAVERKIFKGMYLHLGNDVTILSSSIIGVFDIERTSVQKSINEYLSRCQKSGGIYYVSLDMPKSFVVCDDCVYVTNVGAGTLKKRAIDK